MGTASVWVVGLPVRHLLASDSSLPPSGAEVPARAGILRKGLRAGPRDWDQGPCIPPDPSPRLTGTLSAE